jgi:hypothetical protein
MHITFKDHVLTYHEVEDLENQNLLNYQLPYFLTSKLHFQYLIVVFKESLIIIIIFNNSKVYIA